jgi:2-oxoglutarate ferredoxin oxidoreductase subunit beta
MIFGKERNKGLVLEGMTLKVVTIGENGVTEDDIVVHDAKCEDVSMHLKLASMEYPEYPVALGVIRDVEAPVYDQCMEKQIEDVQEKASVKSLKDLLYSGDVWEVK